MCSAETFLEIRILQFFFLNTCERLGPKQWPGDGLCEFRVFMVKITWNLVVILIFSIKIEEVKNTGPGDAVRILGIHGWNMEWAENWWTIVCFEHFFEKFFVFCPSPTKIIQYNCQSGEIILTSYLIFDECTIQYYFLVFLSLDCYWLL